ncbi:hypothetical protein EDB81DRAFT_866147 [Dactylonectria macrodidyma]|uniref:Wax synthase domain-containing protein n=1 Tax=Dactylonectria macrodidyma TaxID=307937 RepID=A0A9P9JKA6_9HYPO|nr:hypothetical protein EDB81DRAFT_866147 [Dactylonectria macrodidyma]
MDFKPLQPLFYASISFLLTILAVGLLHKRSRIIALVPIWAFNILALTSLHQPRWPGGAHVLATALIIHLGLSVKVLALEEHAANPEVSKRPWSFVDCYRTCANPRVLPVRLTHLDDATAMWLWVVNQFVVVRLFSVFPEQAADNFPSEMELLPLWAIFQPFLRQSIHCLLSIIFVSILGFDQAKDWPPPFGSILEADTVRGFWGRFWHKFPTPIYAFYGLIISRKLMGLKPSSRVEKTFLPMFIFTASAFCHCLVGWSLGNAGPSQSLPFYLPFYEINFLVVALEIAISKGIISSRWFPPLPSALRKGVGMMWVYVWFFCCSEMGLC